MGNREIYLDDEQRAELMAFVRKGVHNAHLITRARTILALDRTEKRSFANGYVFYIGKKI